MPALIPEKISIIDEEGCDNGFSVYKNWRPGKQDFLDTKALVDTQEALVDTQEVDKVIFISNGVMFLWSLAGWEFYDLMFGRYRNETKKPKLIVEYFLKLNHTISDDKLKVTYALIGNKVSLSCEEKDILRCVLDNLEKLSKITFLSKKIYIDMIDAENESIEKDLENIDKNNILIGLAYFYINEYCTNSLPPEFQNNIYTRPIPVGPILYCPENPLIFLGEQGSGEIINPISWEDFIFAMIKGDTTWIKENLSTNVVLKFYNLKSIMDKKTVSTA